MARKAANTAGIPPDPSQVEWVSVDTISPDPANARRHGERNLDAIKASLRRFGQQKPLIVDGNGIVRAGNGTFEAIKALGWPRVMILRTALKGSDATAYAIADNRTGELAEWDAEALAETLRALKDEGFDLDATGYAIGEVDALIGQLNAGFGGEAVDDPAGEWEGMPEFEHEDKEPFRTIVVHFADEEAVQNFAQTVGQEFTDQTKYIWHPRREPNRNLQQYADEA